MTANGGLIVFKEGGIVTANPTQFYSKNEIPVMLFPNPAKTFVNFTNAIKESLIQIITLTSQI
jgi:hypothetical protein